MWQMSGPGSRRLMDGCLLMAWTGRRVEAAHAPPGAGPLVLRLSGGVTVTIDAPPALERPYSALVGARVTGSLGYDSGRLVVAFSDGTRLSVDPQGDRPAWSSTGP